MPNCILIGAPIDEGQRRPGCVMGPAAYRVAGIAAAISELGHGLGLATAAAAVESQGGQIGYRDRPGGGSVFWFRLPVAAPGTAARRNERPPGGRASGVA